MFGMNMGEVLIAAILALVLFGGRLPEVAKTLGAQYARFRKMITDFQAQVNLHEIMDSSPAPKSYGSSAARKTYSDFDDRDEPTAPRFEPPPPAPLPPVKHDADKSDAA